MQSKFFDCKKCPDRTVGCHITCERYANGKRRYEEVKKKRDKDAVEDYFYVSEERKRRKRGR